jgi:cytosine deaminase
MYDHKPFMFEAIVEAYASLDEGGIPIGAVLVKDGRIIGRGHNRMLQKGSAILHAEMDCIESAGLLRGADYRECTLYTTLSPCIMCTGMLLLYKIPCVVIGESSTLKGPEEHLSKRGAKVINLDMFECSQLLEKYITKNQDRWQQEIERIGQACQ